MNKNFYVKNRRNISDIMEDNSILVMFAGEAPHMSADANYDFVPNRNFYYLTGIDREKIILMITKKNGKIEETLFLEKSDPILAKWIGERMKPEEARKVSGIEKTDYIDDFSRIFNFNTSKSFESLYLDLEMQGWDSPLNISHRFAKNVSEKYPYIKIRNIQNTINELRVVKTKEEIENVKKAIDITQEGIINMMKNAKPGMMEYEIEAYFDFVLKGHGVRQYAFNTIAASGINGTVLHYVENNCKTGKEDLILCDLGASYEYYSADITRTFPVSGRFTERQKAVYNIVLKALYETIKVMKPGVPYAKLNETCKEVLTKGCKELGLIKEDAEISKYYYHGVSHYLGLDTHDVGERQDLKAGMILTVEPGLYIEEEGIGIRIEDDVLITENGNEVLSKDIIRTAEEIEELMKK